LLDSEPIQTKMPPAVGFKNQVAKYQQIVNQSRITKPPLNPQSQNPNPVLRNQIDQAHSLIATGDRDGLTYHGDIKQISYDPRDIVNKARVPDFLYRPLYGRPRYINIPELRRLGTTPTAGLCVQTITDYIGGLDWVIRLKDREAEPNAAQDRAIEEVTERVQNPNRNKETFRDIRQKLVRDILHVDAGVTVKVFDFASYVDGNPTKALLPLGRRKMVEYHAYDGGTFTKSPNENGLLPDQESYYQYSYHTYSSPTPFARDELIWMERNPRTDQIYGIGAVEMAFDVIRYEVFGVTSGIDLFTRKNVPKGILSVIDANRQHIREFASRLKDKTLIVDESTDEARWSSENIPIVNQKAEFIKLELEPETMRLLESQQWYIKLIFACFGMTPVEAGFTEDSNRATAIVESESFKKKAIFPVADLIEEYYNKELIPEFGYDFLELAFIHKDIQDEMRQEQLWGDWLKDGRRSINEYRREKGLDDVAWGDQPYQGSDFGTDGEDGMRSMFRDQEQQGQ